MAVLKRKQKSEGETVLNVPNWVIALVLITTILGLAVLLAIYLPDILHWLR